MAPAPTASERKAQIVDAAAQLFADRGYAAVGIDDIGAAVGVSGPAIYKHFGGKQALLAAVIVPTMERFADRMEAVAAGEWAGARPCEAPLDVGRRLVAAALDEAPRLATWVREGHRLTGPAAAALAAAKERCHAAEAAIVRALTPGLDAVSVDLRLAAIEAMNVHMPDRLAERSVSPARLTDLYAAAQLAVLSHPPVPPADPSDLGPWRPPLRRRDEVFRAAIVLFRAKGFHGVGVEEIGEAVGIAGPTVYSHYERKIDILVDAFERGWRRIGGATEEALAGARSARDALDRLIRFTTAAVVDDVDLFAVKAQDVAALPPDALARHLANEAWLGEQWVAVLAEVRRDLTLPDLVSLVRLVAPVVQATAEAAQPTPTRRPEVAALTEAILLAPGP